MSRITLCSSSTFFDKLHEIKASLEKEGHEVLLPNLETYSHIPEQAQAKITYELIRNHFAKIERSDAIYVANYDKNGIKGYIGGNTFLEMGKAFDCRIPIFLMNEVPNQSYRDELLAMEPIVIGEDWKKIMRHL